MEKYRICILTYNKMDILVRKALEKIHDEEMEFLILEGVGDSQISRVNEEIETTGVDVVVAGGMSAACAKEQVDAPVVDFQITSIDYLTAIDKAFCMGREIAVVTYGAPLSDELRRYIAHIGITITNIVYQKESDLRAQLESTSCGVVVGPTLSVEIAVELGKKGLLIYPGEETFINTIRNAKEVAKEVRKNNIKAIYTRAVIKYSINGLILVDPECRVIEFNRSVQKILGNQTLKSGSRIIDLLPDCHADQFIASGQMSETAILRINGVEVLQSWYRIMNKHLLLGAVGIFLKLSDINRVQYEYMERQKREADKKGFTAKYSFRDILGSSKILKERIDEAMMYAESNANVLLSGETGVGKELFAQSIHNESSRKTEPFIALNCAALPETLLESELFGYDEGAFTGGKRGGKKGLFELADGGTLFLDEIGELSPQLQSRLLRVLQEKEIMRVGGDRIIPVDVRVISATNRNLNTDNSFRKDLLYRLKVLEIHIPPLRDRGDDIVELFRYFYKNNGDLASYWEELPAVVLNVIRMYSWPGNIRELQNICERFGLFIRKKQNLNEKSLQRYIVKAIGEDFLMQDIIKKYGGAGKTFTPETIEALSKMLPFNQEQLGEKLGISRTTLWRITKKSTK